MVDHPLFYKNIVPLNRQKHNNLRLNTSASRFGFAAQTNMIPAVVDEIVPAAHAIPILFVPGVAQPAAIFLTGLQPGKNVFVDQKGNWTAGYVPAFVRRYPFIIGDVKDAKSIICIDEDSSLFSKKGEALFSDETKDSDILQTNIRFVNDYLAAAKRTEAFVSALQKFSLFQAITINALLPDKDRQTFHGLLTISVEKLAALSSDEFLELRSQGLLPAIYAQQMSLAGLDRLSREPEQSGDVREADYACGQEVVKPRPN